MNKNNIRIVSAWIMGIVCWLVISTIFNIIMNKMEIPTYIEFGETIIVEHRYYEEYKDGAFTAAGLAFNLLSIMFAARIGMAIYTRKINGGVTMKDNIEFITWSCGFLLFGVGGAFIFMLFRTSNAHLPNVVAGILELALAVLLFYYGKKWRDKKIKLIDSR